MTLEFTVPSMACSACGDTLTQAIKAVDSTATVQADPQTKHLKIETQAPESTIKQAIIAAGYPIP